MVILNDEVLAIAQEIKDAMHLIKFIWSDFLMPVLIGLWHG